MCKSDIDYLEVQLWLQNHPIANKMKAARAPERDIKKKGSLFPLVKKQTP